MNYFTYMLFGFIIGVFAIVVTLIEIYLAGFSIDDMIEDALNKKG